MSLFGFPEGLSGGSKETAYSTSHTTNYESRYQTQWTSNYNTQHSTDKTTSWNTSHTTQYSTTWTSYSGWSIASSLHLSSGGDYFPQGTLSVEYGKFIYLYINGLKPDMGGSRTMTHLDISIGGVPLTNDFGNGNTNWRQIKNHYERYFPKLYQKSNSQWGWSATNYDSGVTETYATSRDSVLSQYQFDQGMNANLIMNGIAQALTAYHTELRYEPAYGGLYRIVTPFYSGFFASSYGTPIYSSNLWIPVTDSQMREKWGHFWRPVQNDWNAMLLPSNYSWQQNQYNARKLGVYNPNGQQIKFWKPASSSARSQNTSRVTTYSTSKATNYSTVYQTSNPTEIETGHNTSHTTTYDTSHITYG